ncbi:hypothetical protein NW762_013413 [Fusarium torreyae]|uniref:Uncharacterized protein n=1 Tax=Fusarium torreyae TaxID=1237075 RepID=A0A9W8RPD7_9HYPO|nr:hypothetical protein NW762_013413 [Fusarium torreyae]
MCILGADMAFYFDFNYHHVLDRSLLPFDLFLPDTTWSPTSGAAVGAIPSHFPSTIYSTAFADPELQSSKSFNSQLATPLNGSLAARNKGIDDKHPEHDRVIASNIPIAKPTIDAHSFTTPKTLNIDRVPYCGQSDDLVYGALLASATRFGPRISVSSPSRRTSSFEDPVSRHRALWAQPGQNPTKACPQAIAARTIRIPRASSPSTTLLAFLTCANPAVSLVRNILLSSRDTIKHFWWDIRDIHSWTGRNTRAIIFVTDGPTLTTPVPISYLLQPI